MVLPPRFIELCETVGTRLDNINPGSEEIAFPKVTALEILNIVDDIPIAVLGGDVISANNGKLEYTYQNWDCSRLTHESLEDYQQRSKVEAKYYIEQYSTDCYEPLFVLVMDSSLNEDVGFEKPVIIYNLKID